MWVKIRQNVQYNESSYPITKRMNWLTTDVMIFMSEVKEHIWIDCLIYVNQNMLYMNGKNWGKMVYTNIIFFIEKMSFIKTLKLAYYKITHVLWGMH